MHYEFVLDAGINVLQLAYTAELVRVVSSRTRPIGRAQFVQMLGSFGLGRPAGADRREEISKCR
jgi:hypothetical protein